MCKLLAKCIKNGEQRAQVIGKLNRIQGLSSIPKTEVQDSIVSVLNQCDEEAELQKIVNLRNNGTWRAAAQIQGEFELRVKRFNEISVCDEPSDISWVYRFNIFYGWLKGVHDGKEAAYCVAEQMASADDSQILYDNLIRRLEQDYAALNTKDLQTKKQLLYNSTQLSSAQIKKMRTYLDCIKNEASRIEVEELLDRLEELEERESNANLETLEAVINHCRVDEDFRRLRDCHSSPKQMQICGQVQGKLELDFLRYYEANVSDNSKDDHWVNRFNVFQGWLQGVLEGRQDSQCIASNLATADTDDTLLITVQQSIELIQQAVQQNDIEVKKEKLLASMKNQLYLVQAMKSHLDCINDQNARSHVAVDLDHLESSKNLEDAIMLGTFDAIFDHCTRFNKDLEKLVDLWRSQDPHGKLESARELGLVELKAMGIYWCPVITVDQ